MSATACIHGRLKCDWVVSKTKSTIYVRALQTPDKLTENEQKEKSCGADWLIKSLLAHLHTLLYFHLSNIWGKKACDWSTANSESQPQSLFNLFKKRKKKKKKTENIKASEGQTSNEQITELYTYTYNSGSTLTSNLFFSEIFNCAFHSGRWTSFAGTAVPNTTQETENEVILVA